MDPKIVAAYKHILRMNDRHFELMVGMYERNMLNQNYVLALETMLGLPEDD